MYFIKAGYRSRLEPEYDNETGESSIVYQPNVYHVAAQVAVQTGSRRIIDLGCGGSEKLSQLSTRFDIIGIDFGLNIAYCREHHNFGSWREHDFDSGEPLPVSAEELSGSVLVSGDVIEHLVRPEGLLDPLRRCLDLGASAAVMSTPERNLTHGVRHMGPPANPSHVREWSIDEFAALLAAHGFCRGSVTLTQSVSTIPDKNSILAVLFGEGAGDR